MSGILEVIESVRQIVNRWVNTKIPITSDIAIGDTIIEVRNTQRFISGDEVMVVLMDLNGLPSHAELPSNYVDEVIDDTHLKMVNPMTINWSSSTSIFLQKCYDTQTLAGIYFGEPDNIPSFPAVCVKASTAGSEWLTIKSTKEVYNIEVSVYNKAAAQEKGYKAHIRLAETIKYGLKRNLFPLIKPYVTTNVTADILPGDVFIKVEDSSVLREGGRILLEGEYSQCETFVERIIDANTIKIKPSSGCALYAASEHPIIIATERFIFNSWPENIAYGEVFKGTLMKSAKISWFAWEEVIWLVPTHEKSLR